MGLPVTSPRLRAAIRLRVGALPADTRDVLEAAAALGQVFRAGTVGLLLGLDAEEAQRRLAPAIERGFVVPEDATRWRFAYPMLRYAVAALGRG